MKDENLMLMLAYSNFSAIFYYLLFFILSIISLRAILSFIIFVLCLHATLHKVIRMHEMFQALLTLFLQLGEGGNVQTLPLIYIFLYLRDSMRKLMNCN